MKREAIVEIGKTDPLSNRGGFNYYSIATDYKEVIYMRIINVVMGSTDHGTNHRLARLVIEHQEAIDGRLLVQDRVFDIITGVFKKGVRMLRIDMEGLRQPEALFVGVSRECQRPYVSSCNIRVIVSKVADIERIKSAALKCGLQVVGSIQI